MYKGNIVPASLVPTFNCIGGIWMPFWGLNYTYKFVVKVVSIVKKINFIWAKTLDYHKHVLQLPLLESSVWIKSQLLIYWFTVSWALWALRLLVTYWYFPDTPLGEYSTCLQLTVNSLFWSVSVHAVSMMKVWKWVLLHIQT